ncbi:MAG: hypothetical protein HKN12_00530 [Gemmatimonadetes bacterium]|nr:hypothetical protein [Gemmatimonadota bacterium]
MRRRDGVTPVRGVRLGWVVGLGVLLAPGAGTVAAETTAAAGTYLPAEPTFTVSRAAGEWFAETSPVELAGLIPGPNVPDEWEREDWDWVDQAEPSVGDGRKSLLTAVMASAVLPGLGERYLGSSRANVFHASEALIWASFAGFRIQGDLRRDRYEEFATTNAGAPGDGDTDYYEHIGLWLSLEEWHDIVRRDARLRFPDDNAAQADFFENNKRYDEGEAWDWSQDETRVRYRQLRSKSERSFRNARLAAGAAVVNRLVSMMDALALARAHNRKIDTEARLELRVAPQLTAEGFSFGPVLSARY